jgi:hypothetical protein
MKRQRWIKQTEDRIEKEIERAQVSQTEQGEETARISLNLVHLALLADLLFHLRGRAPFRC